MEVENRTAITIKTTVAAPIAKVWKCWSDPQHITNWAFASDEWHAPYADNDLKEGGKFQTTMAAKDGSMSFDFEGVYTSIKDHELIEYTILDGRKVSVAFTDNGSTTDIVETFEAEDTLPLEMQQSGWQAILDNFKKYTETCE
ncbi:SRPBCC family protein [Pontibacter korlensis]|uniref:Polyketide cyclase n=1 Tax=Pontibacter korlensis TaxID=400092 RepID=A0A0E3ZJ09_9BACT|nr:SRPBCC family protein [Pontibacter korlensis]AKD04964.1 polyketide cyclase [Pontibacter korlensis]